jgi:hypothetical protein
MPAFAESAPMDLNRNQFFLIGMVVLLLGLQLRLVESYVLNEKATQFIAKRWPDKPVASTDLNGSFFAAQGPSSLRRVVPPKWIGYMLLSVGGVLILHALSMKKPGAP